MTTDEQAIRDLVATWLSATKAGDTQKVLSLMAEDAVFYVAGQPPMRGRAAFAAAMEGGRGKFTMEGTSDIVELTVAGDFAYLSAHIQLTITPIAGGSPIRRSGYTLPVLRKEPAGNWVLVRDANLLTVEKA